MWTLRYTVYVHWTPTVKCLTNIHPRNSNTITTRLTERTNRYIRSKTNKLSLCVPTTISCISNAVARSLSDTNWSMPRPFWEKSSWYVSRKQWKTHIQTKRRSVLAKPTTIWMRGYNCWECLSVMGVRTSLTIVSTLAYLKIEKLSLYQTA